MFEQDSRKSKGQLKKDKHKRKKDSRRSVRSNNLKNTGGEDKIQADIKAGVYIVHFD